MKNYPIAPFLQNGQISPTWLRWLLDLRIAVDEIREEPYVGHTADATLTQYDFGKVHIFNIGASNINVYLPSVDSTDLFSWIRLVRIGTGRLLVWAADSDLIEYSGWPGRIWCDERKRTAANITLMLVEEAKWAIIAGLGIWKVA